MATNAGQETDPALGDNPSYDLAEEHVRQQIEKKVADPEHKDVSTPTNLVTVVRVNDISDCDCVPLSVKALGHYWELTNFHPGPCDHCADYQTRGQL